MDQVREAVREVSRSTPEFVAAQLSPFVKGATPIQIRWAIGALCSNGELHCVRERTSSSPRAYEVTPHLRQSASNLEAQKVAAGELQAVICAWYGQRKSRRFENPYSEAIDEPLRIPVFVTSRADAERIGMGLRTEGL